jgi:hypothetical protein
MPFFTMFNSNFHDHSKIFLIQASMQALWYKYVLSHLMTVLTIRVLIEIGLSMFSGGPRLQNLLERWYCRNKAIEAPT